MAENNRNRGYSRNEDWNNDRGGRNGRNEDYDRNYGSSENRGGNSSNFEEGDSGWQSRYEREEGNRGDRYRSGTYGRHYESDINSGNWGNDRDYGYASYYGSGSTGNSGSETRGNRSRNLYDNDYEGMNRSVYSNSGSRLGGANYGNYGDRGRFPESRSGNNYGRSGDSNYRESNEGNRGDRTWWNRTSDEVSSWFGDDDAERRRDRDRQMRGEHRGKGPKNYNRSDDRIKEDVNDKLSDDPYINATEIEVTVIKGDVTLSGTVDERNAKRRAEDIAESVSGVKNVENRLRVGQSSEKNSDKDSSRGPESRNGDRENASQSTSGIAGSEKNKNKNYVNG